MKKIITALTLALIIGSCTKQTISTNHQPFISIGVGAAASVVDSVSIDGAIFTNSFPIHAHTSVLLPVTGNSHDIMVYVNGITDESIYLNDQFSKLVGGNQTIHFTTSASDGQVKIGIIALPLSAQ